jgi:hypothetical protein
MTAFLRILAAVMVMGSLHADQSNTGLGTQALPFLTWPADARTAALGQAGVAAAFDVNAPAINPAGLSTVRGEEVSLSDDILFQSESMENAAVAVGLFKGAALGVSMDYFNDGPVQRVNAQLQDIGSFTPYAYSAGLSYAQTLVSGLSAGVSAKFVGQDIDTSSASTVAGDLGLLYRGIWQGLSLGGSYQNIGGTLGGFSLPAMARVGAAWHQPFGFRNSVTLMADAQIPQAAVSQATFSGAAELKYTRYICLRAGYQTGNRGGITGLTGPTAGAGFGDAWWQVDYALVPMGDLGMANQFTVEAKF